MSTSDVHRGSDVKCWEHGRYDAQSWGDIKTCNRRGQAERVGAYEARRDMWGAQLDLETAHGVVCSGTGGKELKITRKMRAAWAASSGLRQERFQAAWEDPELFGTSISCYKTCMKFL